MLLLHSMGDKGPNYQTGLMPPGSAFWNCFTCTWDGWRAFDWDKYGVQKWEDTVVKLSNLIKC